MFEYITNDFTMEDDEYMYIKVRGVCNLLCVKVCAERNTKERERGRERQADLNVLLKVHRVVCALYCKEQIVSKQHTVIY